MIYRRRVVWLVVQKDIPLNQLSKMLLAKAVMAQDETFPCDNQFGIFSIEGTFIATRARELFLTIIYIRT